MAREGAGEAAAEAISAPTNLPRLPQIKGMLRFCGGKAHTLAGPQVAALASARSRLKLILTAQGVAISKDDPELFDKALPEAKPAAAVAPLGSTLSMLPPSLMRKRRRESSSSGAASAAAAPPAPKRPAPATAPEVSVDATGGLTTVPPAATAAAAAPAGFSLFAKAPAAAPTPAPAPAAAAVAPTLAAEYDDFMAQLGAMTGDG